MLGAHATDKALVLSDGTFSPTDGNWIEWLLTTQPKEDKIAYDLDYLVAKVLAHSGAEERECRRVLIEHRAYVGNGFKVFYIPGRILTLDFGYGAAHVYTNVYNAKQYYDGVKHEPGISNVKAQHLAAQALGIGQKILAAYDKLNISSKSLTSPVKAWDKSGLWPDAPTIDNIPEEAHLLAYDCIKSNWVEAFQVGHFAHVFDYDINGAYASEMATLQDTRLGQWEHGAAIPHGAVYGFADCIVEIHAPFHPIIMRGKENSLYSPVGIWQSCLTMQEIGFIERYNLGRVKIHDGWWWIPDTAKYPFHHTVLDLWATRRRNEGTATDTICKRILAGMWGKMLELRGSQAEPEFGPHFNPVYGAIVEANVRLRVAQRCIEEKVTPLHVAVDGVIVDKMFTTARTGNDLGQWRLSHSGPCIIVGSGAVGMSGKGGNEEFALSYDWLKGMMQVYPEQSEYEMTKWGFVSLAKALNEGKWGKLGELEQTMRKVRIGEDKKRMYIDGPTCGGDVLSSQYVGQPWSSSVVEVKR